MTSLLAKPKYLYIFVALGLMFWSFPRRGTYETGGFKLKILEPSLFQSGLTFFANLLIFSLSNMDLQVYLR